MIPVAFRFICLFCERNRIALGAVKRKDAGTRPEICCTLQPLSAPEGRGSREICGVCFIYIFARLSSHHTRPLFCLGSFVFSDHKLHQHSPPLFSKKGLSGIFLGSLISSVLLFFSCLVRCLSRIGWLISLLLLFGFYQSFPSNYPSGIQV